MFIFSRKQLHNFEKIFSIVMLLIKKYTYLSIIAFGISFAFLIAGKGSFTWNM